MRHDRRTDELEALVRRIGKNVDTLLWNRMPTDSFGNKTIWDEIVMANKTIPQVAGERITSCVWNLTKNTSLATLYSLSWISWFVPPVKGIDTVVTVLGGKPSGISFLVRRRAITPICNRILDNPTNRESAMGAVTKLLKFVGSNKGFEGQWPLFKKESNDQISSVCSILRQHNQ